MSPGSDWSAPRRPRWDLHPRPSVRQTDDLLADLRELMLGPDGVAPSPSGFRPVALLIELRTREQASCQEAIDTSPYGRGSGRCHREPTIFALDPEGVDPQAREG